MKDTQIIYPSILILIIVWLAASCANPSTTPTSAGGSSPTLTSVTSNPASTPSPTPVSPSPPTSSQTSSDDWPTYHRDSFRTGFVAGASLGSTAHRLWTSDRLDGDVYAEPLVIGGKVLAATEQNSVYALDFTTGKQVWKVNLGTPVPLSQLGCGNIDPSGITSTPVADPAAKRLYVVARLQPNHHELFILDTDAGTVVSHRTVDPPGADPRVQQQRAALALSKGKVYVAFGGLEGDCGNFYGWVVGAPVSGNDPLITYRVSPHRGASLWAPAGPAADSTGNLYVTSGNGYSGSTFD